jgi:hypothetical protein
MQPASDPASSTIAKNFADAPNAARLQVRELTDV